MEANLSVPTQVFTSAGSGTSDTLLSGKYCNSFDHAY